VSANKACWDRLRHTVHLLGLCVGPDDTYLGLRGLRTLGVRLAHHYEAGLKVARWLQGRQEIARILHPALPGCPGHDVWKRDFSGGSGLFSIVFRPTTMARVNAFLNALRLFGIGASWGGFESLAIPFDCRTIRTATQWNPEGPTVRLHIGIEDVNDLIADLERGLAALAAA
jgi:cystathionine beta-lyase